MPAHERYDVSASSLAPVLNDALYDDAYLLVAWVQDQQIRGNCMANIAGKAYAMNLLTPLIDPT